MRHAANACQVQLDPVVRMATIWAQDHPDIVALENAARELRRLFVMELHFSAPEL